ncbi:MAG TPA: MFS transporter [Kofleriaceae bacterium]|nr:MFS transporter [Kofleriaceae bacterium]
MANVTPAQSLSSEERKVIFASSLGTVFEWYDFYLYATLTPFFAASFFPPGSDTAQLLSALATYAAGFLVRPFGALVFGRVGDLVGRKYTFLVTISVMGISTFGVGLLPTYATVGLAAPALLTLLRLLQGLALGGEYGGAVIYVAEHSDPKRRGYTTSWIQTTATVGFFLSLLVIGLCRKSFFTDESFKDWGWRVPFWFSLVLLGFSLYIRLKLHESPVFLKMKSEARVSKNPLTESFLRYPNVKYVVLALFGAVAGQGVVWYTGQFYALFFLTNTLKVDYWTSYLLMGGALLIATPFFVVVGRLSDRIGRVKLIALGCLLAAVTYFGVFKQLTHAMNPALEAFRDSTAITVAADDSTCNFHLFTTAKTQYSECDRVRDFFTKRGLSFESKPADPAAPVVVQIGEVRLEGWKPDKPGTDDARYTKVLADHKYPSKAEGSNWVLGLILLAYLVLLVTLVYGPIAALLVELFPAKIRYTSMSLPYHLANGWIGGLVPFVAAAMAANAGNIYYGLWYPVIVAAITLVVGLSFLRDAKPDFDINA